MAYEFLKKLFTPAKEGEQPKAMTYEELEAAIDADKGISLVNLTDGGYVSKDKFDAKNTELKGVQAQLASANDTIKGFEGQDVEKIKKQVTDWETKYNTDTQALKDQLSQQNRAHQEDRFFAGYKFRDEFAEAGARAAFKKQNFALSEETGEFTGAKAWMDALMKDDKYKNAFVTEDDKGSDDPQPQPQFSNPTPKQPQQQNTNPFNFAFTAILIAFFGLGWAITHRKG